MCSLVCVGCPPPGGATDWQRLEDRHACMRLENLTLSQSLWLAVLRYFIAVLRSSRREKHFGTLFSR